MKHTSITRLSLSSCSLIALLVGCQPEPTGGEGATGEERVTDGKGDVIQGQGDEKPGLCVGIRGNGQNIFAHFGGLARIHEEYGALTAVAGGSSGSITTFLTESMYANPALRTCQDQSCSDAEVGARAALMYKSIEGYAGVISQSEEVAAFQLLLPLVKRLKAGGVGELVEGGQLQQAREAMLDVLQSEDLRVLVNPEVLGLLKESPDADFHVKDIWASVASFGSFKVDSAMVLLRPGVLSFDGVTSLIGRVGDFYAGYGFPAGDSSWSAFLDECAAPSRGMAWGELRGLATSSGESCGQMYDAMLTSWRADALNPATQGSYTSRVDEVVGAHFPALVTTSLMTGETVSKWQAARAQYMTAQPVTFEPSFDDVRLGYWGQDEDLETIAANAYGYEDIKTQKFMSLGEATYREVLAISPAEPGLARALEVSPGVVSAGGWSDLEPSLVLKNMGCDQVILLTRQGDTVGFGADVARQLGMTDAGQDALFTTHTESSVKLSLKEADGVWCTDWDGQDSLNFPQIVGDAYHAPLEVHTDWLGTGSYANVSSNLNLIGCTPGVGK